MRRLTLMGLVGILALAMMAPAAFADGDATVTSPADGDIVYSNTLQLSATEDVEDRTLRWRIRDLACDDDTQSASDNVAGEDVPFDGEFEAEIDISELPAGQYCFVYNTWWDADESDDDAGSRVLHDFYIVDEYAKVGGVLSLHEPSRGNGTHSMEGVVGNAGDAGTVGAITVNYRELGEYVTYEADSLQLSQATGVGVYDYKRADIDTEDGGRFFVLDRDADTDEERLDAPRGAIQFFSEWPLPSDYDESDYDINATPPGTGWDSWVPMSHGNNHVGTR